MLRELHIENIAVIERADIEPGPGLNVLTGETGAGKSIVIDSLQAVLGGRVSRELVRTGAPKAAVSAVFSSERAEKYLADSGLDAEDGEIILRRRVSAEGKSSAAVNGQSVTAAELRGSARCCWISTARTTAAPSSTRRTTALISTPSRSSTASSPPTA